MAMCNISIIRQTNYMSMKWKVHFDESFFLIQENVTISKIAKKIIIEHRRSFSCWLSFFWNCTLLESTVPSMDLS